MMAAIGQSQCWTGTAAEDELSITGMDLRLREMDSHLRAERDVRASTERQVTAPSAKVLAPRQRPMTPGAHPDSTLMEEVPLPAVQQTTETATRKRAKFDPKTCVFDERMLTPQPITPRSKKTFVPESKKDSAYWIKRTRNNMAAKKSREARQVKENQKMLRLAFLEKEVGNLRQQLEEALQENTALKERLSAEPDRKALEEVTLENVQLREVLDKVRNIIANT